jgi:hypothetical protein
MATFALLSGLQMRSSAVVMRDCDILFARRRPPTTMLETQ